MAKVVIVVVTLATGLGGAETTPRGYSDFAGFEESDGLRVFRAGAGKASPRVIYGGSEFVFWSPAVCLPVVDQQERVVLVGSDGVLHAIGGHGGRLWRKSLDYISDPTGLVAWGHYVVYMEGPGSAGYILHSAKTRRDYERMIEETYKVSCCDARTGRRIWQAPLTNCGEPLLITDKGTLLGVDLNLRDVFARSERPRMMVVVTDCRTGKARSRMLVERNSRVPAKDVVSSIDLEHCAWRESRRGLAVHLRPLFRTMHGRTGGLRRRAQKWLWMARALGLSEDYATWREGIVTGISISPSFRTISFTYVDRNGHQLQKSFGGARQPTVLPPR
jgi:hypothetical protein